MTVAAHHGRQILVEKEFVVRRGIARAEGPAFELIGHERECGEMMGHKN
jgi:hypothetical protein